MSVTDDLKPSTQGCNLTRREIIDGGWHYRKDLINLTLSKHAIRRVEERMLGEFVIVPKMARITEKNICSGRSHNGKQLSSVKIRLEYTKSKWLYLVICPYSGVVKTLYLNYKNAKKEDEARKKANEERDCCVETQGLENQAEDNGTNGEREGGEYENEEVFPRSVDGSKKSRWQKLLGAFRKIPW